MSSQGASPPAVVGSSSEKPNPPENSSTAETLPPPKETGPPTTVQPDQPAATAQTLPAPADETSVITPAGVIPAVPGQQQQPGAGRIPAVIAPPLPAQRRAAPSRNKSGRDDLDSKMLIGAVAGAVLLVLFMAAVVCCACYSKRKKKKMKQQQFGDQDHMHSYAPNGIQFYTNHPPSHQKSKWHSPDHAIHIPPPMGVPGGGHHSADMGSTLSSPSSHSMAAPPPTLGFNKNSFSYDELAAATSGFAQSNLLGQGGFGYVHKGVLLGGVEVAVKSLKSGSGQGEREFQAEVEIISRVHHRHLVSLVGYCIAGGQRMLVYEFVPNNNLEFRLHGKGRPPIEWSMRMKIAMGSAKGLAYLHEDCHPRIIHRDIKTANILLDYSFEAKVADFGLAKLTSDDNTHVSTRIMGTFGYLAPEYVSSGKLTEKSDVYSFGVMMLELITGQRPVDMTGHMDESLVEWARPLLQQAMEDGNYDQFADPRLEKRYEPHEMKRMVACASACVRHSARRRPNMSHIVRALEGDYSLDDLNDGVKPGQSTTFNSSSDEATTTTTTYSAQMRKFRQMALETQEYSSSEFGATSEYGLNPSTSSDSVESREESSINQTLKHTP